MDGDETVAGWMENLARSKPRYYRDNLNFISREMVKYSRASLHKTFCICLYKGVYNARDLLSLCNRRYRQIAEPVSAPDGNICDIMDVVPEKTDMNQYNRLFA